MRTAIERFPKALIFVGLVLLVVAAGRYLARLVEYDLTISFVIIGGVLVGLGVLLGGD